MTKPIRMGNNINPSTGLSKRSLKYWIWVVNPWRLPMDHNFTPTKKKQAE